MPPPPPPSPRFLGNFFFGLGGLCVCTCFVLCPRYTPPPRTFRGSALIGYVPGGCMLCVVYSSSILPPPGSLLGMCLLPFEGCADLNLGYFGVFFGGEESEWHSFCVFFSSNLLFPSPIQARAAVRLGDKPTLLLCFRLGAVGSSPAFSLHGGGRFWV